MSTTNAKRKRSRNKGVVDAVEQMPNFTKSLLHMNGADGSTVFTDETGKIWTPVGTAQIDNAQSKFGGTSGFFSYGSNYIHTPDHDDFHLSNLDWTIDFWIRYNGVTGGFNIISQVQAVGTDWMDLWTSFPTPRLTFSHWGGGVQTATFYATVSMSVGVWYHIAVERFGNIPIIAQNGILLTVTETVAIAGKTLSNLTNRIEVPSWNSGSAPESCWIDEFRLSKGIARWTENFTPPSIEYHPSQ